MIQILARNPSCRVDLYNELKVSDLTDEYLHRFYWDNEKEYLAFQKMRDNALGSTAQNNYNNDSNSSSSKLQITEKHNFIW